MHGETLKLLSIVLLKHDADTEIDTGH